MSNSYQNTLGLAGAMVLAVSMTGCASHAPSADFILSPPQQQRVDANDVVAVKLDLASKVEMTQIDQQRLTKLISKQIDSKKRENVQAAEPKQYEFDVTITQYEKGNAFARLMLAGLGQIHLDGHIIVWSLPAREKYAEFKVEKTFAWGGLVGASTHIEEVEPAFAESIANAVVDSQ